MNNLILKIFGFIKNVIYFFRMASVFLIIMLVLYWIQNLIGAQWGWMNFIKPLLEWVLNFANSIYSLSFDFFGANFELKYLTALSLLALFAVAMKFVDFGVSVLEGAYKSAHFVYKKTTEKVFNDNLESKITYEQKKLKKYTLVIHTQVKKKFSHQELHIDIDHHNELMNDFISSKTSQTPSEYDGGFMYSFDNFDKIDSVLVLLFKILNANGPLDYAFCIQIDDQINKLNKLVELKHFGKVTMAADTAYRYRFNASHRFQVVPVGEFKYDGGTLEVHEFKEISVI